MFLNFDLNSLSDEALTEKISSTLRYMNMLGFGNDSSFNSLQNMLASLYDEQQRRYDKRLADQIIRKSKDVIDTNAKSAASKQQGPKKQKPKSAGGVDRPSFVRTTKPANDKI